MKVFHVDAFTDRIFHGNPAAVCIMDGPARVSLMQGFAGEMNLSETAFLYPQGDGFSLKWFTPKTEVSLCGHATLASAHILWQERITSPSETIKFDTKSGRLLATRHDDLIELDFPARPPLASKPSKALEHALGIVPKYTGRNQDDYLLEIEDEDELRHLAPDFSLLTTVNARGVCVTCVSKSRKYDFVSRFFAPAVGINEDPVTGSAHCCLGPFWGKKPGKKEMVGYQASARGGVVEVRLKGARVLLGGRAVTVASGELTKAGSGSISYEHLKSRFI